MLYSDMPNNQQRGFDGDFGMGMSSGYGGMDNSNQKMAALNKLK